MKIHSSQTMLATLLLLGVILAPVSGQSADDDEVMLLVPDYSHKIFSGYLGLNFIKEQRVHYVFYHSQNDVSKDPLIVWYTGGPGCSSLLAAFHENGPFVFRSGYHQLNLNEGSWNKKANLLYFELPLNVGFSEGNDEGQVYNDENFASAALIILRNFLSRFPAFKKNQLYLSGHGYAGVFVTYLAKYIMDEFNDPDVIYNDKFNLKGILVGNPCTLKNECYASGSQKQSYYHYQFLYNRAFINRKMWDDFRGICSFDYDGRSCFAQRVKIDKFFNTTSSSMYNIYDKCYKGLNGSNYINTGCEDDAALIDYFNDNHNRELWNIKGDKVWTPCNTTIIEKYLNKNNSYWIYPLLIKNKLRIWIYSGDLDSYVPIIGTKKWVSDLRHELNMPIKRIWREWWVRGQHKGEDQVGGYIWELSDITLVTVRGAGFRTGLDQPKAMAEIVEGFLAGTTLPYKNQ